MDKGDGPLQQLRKLKSGVVLGSIKASPLIQVSSSFDSYKV